MWINRANENKAVVCWVGMYERRLGFVVVFLLFFICCVFYFIIIVCFCCVFFYCCMLFYLIIIVFFFFSLLCIECRLDDLAYVCVSLFVDVR